MSQQLGKPAVIAVSKVRENTEALRTKVDKDSVSYQELVKSIRLHGFTSTIQVREESDPTTGDVTYPLVDGLHRFTAACEVGLEEIPALIVSIEQSKVLAAQVMANAVRVDTAPAQYAAALKKILQHDPMTLEELANKVGKSKAWVENQLKLTKLTPDIQKLVDDGKVVVTNAISLSSLPQDKQADYLTEAMSQSPATFGPRITEILKEIRSAARQGRPAVVEFKPIAQPRKTAALKTVLDEAEAGPSVTLKSLLDSNGVTDPYEAALLTLKYVLSLDPQSTAAQKAKWDAEQKAKKDAAEARKAEREAKKQKDAAKTAAETVTAA